MLYIGEVIRGKWNSNRYIILKKLGQGGIGAVYKVKDRFGNIKAIKISRDMNSITREYENIKKFKNIKVVPVIYELDDYKKYGETLHFFILEYIEGYNLKQIMLMKNFYIRDIITILVVILRNLKVIYDLGYVYGDIKLENIMVAKTSKKIYLIDFGGAVDKSLGIKEYTPTYNMVSWGINSKDQIRNMIFSVNMLMVSMVLGEEPSPLLVNLKEVSLKLKGESIDNGLKRLLISGFKGYHRDIGKYIGDLRSITLKKTSKKSTFKDIDFIDFIFKGSISVFLLVLIIGVKTNWM